MANEPSCFARKQHLKKHFFSIKQAKKDLGSKTMSPIRVFCTKNLHLKQN